MQDPNLLSPTSVSVSPCEGTLWVVSSAPRRKSMGPLWPRDVRDRFVRLCLLTATPQRQGGQRTGEGRGQAMETEAKQGLQRRKVGAKNTHRLPQQFDI
jgi:hypothetical protein